MGSSKSSLTIHVKYNGLPTSAPEGVAMRIIPLLGLVPPHALPSRPLPRSPLEVSVDRAVDLPRSQGPTTKRSGAYVEEENAASGAKTK